MVYHPSPKEKYHGSTLILIYTKSPYIGINFHIFKSIYKNVTDESRTPFRIDRGNQPRSFANNVTA
jgi:hypothetical protein